MLLIRTYSSVCFAPDDANPSLPPPLLSLPPSLQALFLTQWLVVVIFLLLAALDLLSEHRRTNLLSPFLWTFNPFEVRCPRPVFLMCARI